MISYVLYFSMKTMGFEERKLANRALIPSEEERGDGRRK
jgi:hypothetical protein